MQVKVVRGGVNKMRIEKTGMAVIPGGLNDICRIPSPWRRAPVQVLAFAPEAQ